MIRQTSIAAILMTIVASPAAVGAAAPASVQGNVILGRVSTTALAIWDATDRVAALEAAKEPASEILRTLESESAIAARSMAADVGRASSVTVRITYRKIGAISPAYGTATFEGIERLATVTFPASGLAGKAAGYYDSLAKGTTPSGVAISVTGTLPT